MPRDNFERQTFFSISVCFSYNLLSALLLHRYGFKIDGQNGENVKKEALREVHPHKETTILWDILMLNHTLYQSVLRRIWIILNYVLHATAGHHHVVTSNVVTQLHHQHHHISHIETTSKVAEALIYSRPTGKGNMICMIQKHKTL